jgi:hypothetical protein
VVATDVSCFSKFAAPVGKNMASGTTRPAREFRNWTPGDGVYRPSRLSNSARPASEPQSAHGLPEARSVYSQMPMFMHKLAVHLAADQLYATLLRAPALGHRRARCNARSAAAAMQISLMADHPATPAARPAGGKNRVAPALLIRARTCLPKLLGVKNI